MKRALVIILSLVLMLSILPMSAFAAKESFIAISDVVINEIPSPAAGTEVQFSANCTTQYAGVNSVKWYEKKTESESGTALANGAKYKPSYYYTVSVELKITHNAYYFDSNGSGVNATVNGKAAEVVTNNSAQVIVVEYTFPMCLATVSKFEFTLAAPTAGAAPHYPLLTGTGYESNNRGNNGAALENGIYWRNETDNKVLYPDENPKFEAGKKYSANITVATTTGYRVSSSYTVKVNGAAVTSTKVDNECITFKVEFTVPKAHTHTDSQWKTDADGHWKVCTDTECGAVTVNKEAHKDANKDNKCDVCAYAIPKNESTESGKPDVSTPVVDTEPDTSEPDSSVPAMDQDVDPSEDKEDKDDKDDKDGDNTLIFIIIGAVLVLAIVGTVTLIVLKKKK